jgi:septal ring factor EnvC (AmiA/AmiB activator)
MKSSIILFFALLPFCLFAQKQDPRVTAEERLKEYRSYINIQDEEAKKLLQEFIRMEEELMEMRGKIAALQVQLDRSLQQHLMKIEATLKPEQQAQLAHLRNTGKFNNGSACDMEHCCLHATPKRVERPLARPDARATARPAQEMPAK